MIKIDFINPYNFVPLGDREPPRQEKEAYYRAGDSFLSGWMDITVYLKTPLIIPDGSQPQYLEMDGSQIAENLLTEEKKRNAHKKYSFFRVPDKSDKDKENADCRIPGSEIRGMIRSAYEAVSNSCVPFLLNDKKISQRVPVYGALPQRGLLAYDTEKAQWTLYAADTTLEVVSRSDIENHLKEGKYYINGKVYYPGSYIPEKEAWLQFNYPVNKQNYHVAYLKKGEPVIIWSNDLPYEMMCSVLKRDGVTGGQKNPNAKVEKCLLEALSLVSALSRSETERLR